MSSKEFWTQLAANVVAVFVVALILHWFNPSKRFVDYLTAK